MVKLAQEIDEPCDIDQQTAECHLMAWPYQRRLVAQRDDLRPVQGGEEDTNERVMTSHTEMCEDCEVTSVEEGHDVDGRHAPQSDETAGIPRPLKDEMTAVLTAFLKKGLDRKTNHQDLTKAETEEIFVLTKGIGEKETVALKLEQSSKEVAQKPPPWRDKLRIEGESVNADEKNTDGDTGPDEVFDRGESMLWLASSYLEHRATIQEGVVIFVPCLNNLELVGTVQNTIPEELER